MSRWKRRFLLKTIIFRFHVSFREGNGWNLKNLPFQGAWPCIWWVIQGFQVYILVCPTSCYFWSRCLSFSRLVGYVSFLEGRCWKMTLLFQKGWFFGSSRYSFRVSICWKSGEGSGNQWNQAREMGYLLFGVDMRKNWRNNRDLHASQKPQNNISIFFDHSNCWSHFLDKVFPKGRIVENTLPETNSKSSENRGIPGSFGDSELGKPPFFG